MSRCCGQGSRTLLHSPSCSIHWPWAWRSRHQRLALALALTLAIGGLVLLLSTGLSGSGSGSGGGFFTFRALLASRSRSALGAATRTVPMDVVLVCVGSDHARRVMTLVKSIRFYSRRPVHLHLLTDQTTATSLKTLFDSWSLPELHVAYYMVEQRLAGASFAGLETHHYAGKYAFLKLLIADLLPLHLDRVLVLDTDVLLLEDLEHLWRWFDRMGPRAAMAVAPNLSRWYQRDGGLQPHPWPAPQPHGVNTGVMLLKLARLRELGWQRLWEATVAAVLQDPTLGVTTAPLADQDVINAVLSQQPSLAQQLPCEFNFQLSENTLAFEACAAREPVVVHWNSPAKLRVALNGTQRFLAFEHLFATLDGALLHHMAAGPTEGLSPARPPPLPLPQPCQAFAPPRSANSREFPRFFCLDRPAVDPHDVTVITALTFSRIDMLLQLAAGYEGPISAAVYASDAEADQVVKLLAGDEHLRHHRFLCLHLLFRDTSVEEDLPINRLRNMALAAATTEVVFHLDVDFAVPKGLHAYLRQAAPAMALHANHTVLVVPAFETSDYRLAVPGDKAAFLHAWDAGTVRPFREDVWPAAHRATDFGRWRHASLPYVIDWQQDFEPYVVMARCCVPHFDERFFGFGWNKVSHIMELAAAGLAFVVAPEAYVVHQAHAPSLSILRYRSQREYRACLQALKDVFVGDLRRRYGSAVI